MQDFPCSQLQTCQFSLLSNFTLRLNSVNTSSQHNNNLPLAQLLPLVPALFLHLHQHKRQFSDLINYETRTDPAEKQPFSFPVFLSVGQLSALFRMFQQKGGGARRQMGASSQRKGKSTWSLSAAVQGYTSLKCSLSYSLRIFQALPNTCSPEAMLPTAVPSAAGLCQLSSEALEESVVQTADPYQCQLQAVFAKAKGNPKTPLPRKDIGCLPASETL